MAAPNSHPSAWVMASIKALPMRPAAPVTATLTIMLVYLFICYCGEYLSPPEK
jgi:hypothetical protein